MGGTNAQLPIGRQVSLPGHFDLPVTLESARPLGKGFECRVRLHDGTLDEAVISEQEAAALVGGTTDTDSKTPLANADHLRLLVESARIRLAYAHDRQFAVSLSGIRTLPHQIEAVYIRMLPQPRLRFLLADDPGAGKTIMAGLLVKEMKLREAIECVLILCREYLQKSYTARQRAAQDRVMSLRARENREKSDPPVAIARQRAENHLTDLGRTHKERMAGLDRLSIARHGPVRHVATALVLPATDLATLAQRMGEGPGVRAAISELLDDLDPEVNRQSELAAENVVIACETKRGWETERVGHLKIGFDVRSLGPADPQTGYRDPVTSLRRIEVKGRKRGQTIRLTTNEWYKAIQLGDSYWLYVVWDPLGKPDPTPLMIQNPAKHLDHAKKGVVVARFFDIPAAAIELAAKKG